MRGDRDSEIAIITEDTALVDSLMNGKPFKACKFAYHLRMALMSEHLGLSKSSPESSLLVDPILHESFHLWHRTAERNTELFEKIFPDIPSNRIHSLNKIPPADPLSVPFEEALNLLHQVKGHLVLFPYYFLKNESLRPEITDVKVKAVDRAIFQ